MKEHDKSARSVDVQAAPSEAVPLPAVPSQVRPPTLEPENETSVHRPSRWEGALVAPLPFVPLGVGLSLLAASHITEDPILSQAREVPGIMLSVIGSLVLLLGRTNRR